MKFFSLYLSYTLALLTFDQPFEYMPTTIVRIQIQL